MCIEKDFWIEVIIIFYLDYLELKYCSTPYQHTNFYKEIKYFNKLFSIRFKKYFSFFDINKASIFRGKNVNIVLFKQVHSKFMDKISFTVNFYNCA
jgi:hypothetical protein